MLTWKTQCKRDMRHRPGPNTDLRLCPLERLPLRWANRGIWGWFSGEAELPALPPGERCGEAGSVW